MAVQAIYTVASLTTRVRSLIDEPIEANSAVTDAELLYFFNLCQLDISTRFPVAPYSSGSISGSSFDSAKEYTMSQDMFAVEVVHHNQMAIDPIEYAPYDDGRFVPRGYYMRYNKIGIPSVQSGDTVKIWGRGVLAEMTSASTPALPAVYSMPLIAYAVSMCKAKDQDEQGQTFWTQVYERDLQKANKVSALTQVGVRQIRSAY